MLKKRLSFLLPSQEPAEAPGRRGQGFEEISKVIVKSRAAIRQKMIDLKIKVLLPKEQQQVVSGGKS